MDYDLKIKINDAFGNITYYSSFKLVPNGRKSYFGELLFTAYSNSFRPIRFACIERSASQPFYKNIEINLQNVDNYRQLNINIKDCTAYGKTINKLVNTYRMFKAYNYGLRYINKHLFRPDLVHLHVALPAGKIALY